MYTFTCHYCGKEFKSNNKKRKFCSKSCSSKNKWSNKEYKEKMIDVFNTSEYKEKISQASKRTANNPNINASKSAKMKEKWKSNSFKENISKKLKEHCSSQEVRIQMSERIKQCFIDNPLLHKIRSDAAKDIHNRPEVIKRKSEKMKVHWSNPEWVSNNYESKSHYTYYDYKLPSGKIVKVQGYEPQVLTELLNIFDETDIFISVKDINKEIGLIKYCFNDKEHIYYPDIYIKSINTIIEVKSQWTFEQHKEKNLAKQKACLEQGFNFEFAIR